ncbi:MAG: hypothetical protein QM736_22720 [Vicinamibacterales bacterium]
MSTGEQRHEHLVDDFILTDDDLAKLREDALTPFGDPLCTGRARIRIRSRQTPRIGELVSW